LWLSYKFEREFFEREQAEKARKALAKTISELLK